MFKISSKYLNVVLNASSFSSFTFKLVKSYSSFNITYYIDSFIQQNAVFVWSVDYHLVAQDVITTY